jgi:hypothetical protein
VNSHILSYLTYPKKVVTPPPPFKNPGYATGRVRSRFIHTRDAHGSSGRGVFAL